jgi:alkylation response protein AidB-like acyl-CoA dehydrogenase
MAEPGALTEPDTASDSELRLIREAVREYADRRLVPIAEEADTTGRFPIEVVREMGELGFMGIGFPEAYGGAGGSKLAFAMTVEEVYRASAGIAASGFMSPLIAHDLLMAASEEQRQRLVPPILRGESMAALAVTEPDAGSDAGAIRTRATKTDGGYRISGFKRFITNATIAETVLVMARTTAGAGNRGLSLFAVEQGTPGMAPQPPIAKLGWRCSDTADIAFDDCEVPESALIGELDAGFKVVMHGFNLERIVLATGSIGLGQAALEATIGYATERTQFGAPIGTFQSVREGIARMAADVEAARQLAYHAARRLDAGAPCTAEASMAKLVASEMCQRVTTKAIQLHGGVGFTMELPVQRYHRDSLIMTIGGGTSEIQAEVIARALGLPRPTQKEQK